MTPENNFVTNASDLPLVMSAEDIQRMGFSRSNAYALLNREDMPVIVIGKRRYLMRDKFLGTLGLPEIKAAMQQPPNNLPAECRLNAHICPLMRFFTEMMSEYNLAETRRRGA